MPQVYGPTKADVFMEGGRAVRQGASSLGDALTSRRQKRLNFTQNFVQENFNGDWVEFAKKNKGMFKRSLRDMGAMGILGDVKMSDDNFEGFWNDFVKTENQSPEQIQNSAVRNFYSLIGQPGPGGAQAGTQPQGGAQLPNTQIDDILVGMVRDPNRAGVTGVQQPPQTGQTGTGGPQYTPRTLDPTLFPQGGTQPVTPAPQEGQPTTNPVGEAFAALQAERQRLLTSGVAFDQADALAVKNLTNSGRLSPAAVQALPQAVGLRQAPEGTATPGMGLQQVAPATSTPQTAGPVENPAQWFEANRSQYTGLVEQARQSGADTAWGAADQTLGFGKQAIEDFEAEKDTPGAEQVKQFMLNNGIQNSLDVRTIRNNIINSVAAGDRPADYFVAEYENTTENPVTGRKFEATGGQEEPSPEGPAEQPEQPMAPEDYAVQTDMPTGLFSRNEYKEEAIRSIGENSVRGLEALYLKGLENATSRENAAARTAMAKLNNKAKSGASRSANRRVFEQVRSQMIDEVTGQDQAAVLDFMLNSTEGGMDTLSKAYLPANVREQQQLERQVDQFWAKFSQDNEQLDLGWADLALRAKLGAAQYLMSQGASLAMANEAMSEELKMAGEAASRLIEMYREQALEKYPNNAAKREEWLKEALAADTKLEDAEAITALITSRATGTSLDINKELIKNLGATGFLGIFGRQEGEATTFGLDWTGTRQAEAAQTESESVADSWINAENLR